MKYRHIPTGIIVNSSGELPSAMYEPLEEKAEKPAKATKKRKKEN